MTDTHATDAERLREALEALIAELDACPRYESGPGGMTIDAQIDRTRIRNVPARAVEDAREALNALPAIARAVAAPVETFTREQMLAEVDRRVERALFAARAVAAPVEGETPVAWASADDLREAHLTVQKSARVYVKKRSDDAHLDTPLYTHPRAVAAPVEGEAGEILTKLRGQMDHVALGAQIRQVDIVSAVARLSSLVDDAAALITSLSARLAEAERERDEALDAICTGTAPSQEDQDRAFAVLARARARTAAPATTTEGGEA